MSFKISNWGEALLLGCALGYAAAGTLKLRLYTNNVTPTDNDTVGTYTEMGAVEAYAAKSLAPGSWAAPVAGTGSGTSLSNKASISYPQQVWTADGTGGSVTVYGYFITDSGGTNLVGAEKFPAPVTVSINGDVIKVTPNITNATE